MNISLSTDQTKRAAVIKNNYEQVRERIEKAAHRSGRKHERIRIVVVSKAQPAEVIQSAVLAGIRDFGENYPEETIQKMDQIKSPEVTWHMIGHLQSRKAKIVAERFHWFHALDSIKLADKLNRELAERKRSIPVLLEFNVGGEESKAGWLASDEADWPRLADDIAPVFNFPCLEIRGLMTMPPLETQAEISRRYFAKLRKLRDFLVGRIGSVQLPELSMGTSADFEAAVEEGATMVRIGQAILGPRPEK